MANGSEKSVSKSAECLKVYVGTGIYRIWVLGPDNEN